MSRRPNCVVMVAFDHGSITIQTAMTKPQIKAAMKGDERGEVVITSVTETKVRTNPASPEIDYILGDEEICFNKHKVSFHSISVAKDPPKIQTLDGIINLQGVNRKA